MLPSNLGKGGTTPGGSRSSVALRYPYEDVKQETDWVLFTFYKYTAPFSKEGFGGIGNDKSVVDYNKSSSGLDATGTTVVLYMPEDIEGQYGASWQDTNISTAARGALGAFGDATGKDLGGAFTTALDAGKTMVDNAFTKGTLAAKGISELLAKTNFGSLSVNDVFAASTGQILNPNTEVLYKGPKMRNFSLSFKMVPYNEDDTIRIRKIIHAFKYATLPEWGGAGDEKASFVKVPQIVDVSFMQGGKAHPWVTQYKPSVITDFSVSYTPDGAWARLANGSPVATTMRISFQETKMVYANELQEGGPSY